MNSVDDSTVRPDPSKVLNWDRFILGLKKTTKEFIENVLENIIESIVITNIDGRLIFFNKFSEEMFEYKAEEVLNRHLAILGATEPDVLGHIRQNKPFRGEITLKTKKGRRFPAHVRCVPLRDEREVPIAMVGVARDLTKEKEKELTDQKIARIKEFNENIISSLKDGIQIIDLDGTIKFANTRLEKMLEYGPETLVGLSYSSVVVEEGHDHFRDLLNSVAGDPENAFFQTNFMTRSGKKIPVLVSSSPFIEDGNTVGIVTVVTDVSEIQRLKEELFQSEKMSLIGTLASEVAHEINNPLGGLIMAVRMLTDDIREGRIDPQAILQELQEIDNDARRCKTIVQKLLKFARREPEGRTMLDVSGVIDDALLLVQRQAELEGISFSKIYEENLPDIEGNSNDLQQVLINLVENARDAMPEGGIITVSSERLTTAKGKCVVISIADTGLGVSPEVADRIFEPFFTTKAKGKGTGLGLSVSKRIVEEHGGQITVRNSPGGGAVFSILLPAALDTKRGFK